MTLPRRYRLTGKKAFNGVFERPAVSADECFKVLARLNGLDHSKLGMAVSRKVDRRAVARNRLKRIIRESFRAHYRPTRDPLPADFVVLPRARAVSTPNAKLFEHLSRHWRRIDQRLGLTNKQGLEAGAVALPTTGTGGDGRPN